MPPWGAWNLWNPEQLCASRLTYIYISLTRYFFTPKLLFYCGHATTLNFSFLLLWQCAFSLPPAWPLFPIILSKWKLPMGSSWMCLVMVAVSSSKWTQITTAKGWSEQCTHLTTVLNQVWLKENLGEVNVWLVCKYDYESIILLHKQWKAQGLLSSPAWQQAAHQDLPLSRDTSQGYSSKLKHFLPQKVLDKWLIAW